MLLDCSDRVTDLHSQLGQLPAYFFCVNLSNIMHLAAYHSDTIPREIYHRKSETFAKNYFTFNPILNGEEKFKK